MRKPKYVKSFRDRHGRIRHYFAPGKGAKQIPLPGSPYSTEFMDAYDAALKAWQTGNEPSGSAIGADRVKSGTMEALIHTYYNTVDYKNLAPVTRRTYRNTLERMRAEFGPLPVSELKRKHIEAIMAKRADKPEAANGLRKMFKILMNLAVRLEWRDVDPTIGIKRIRSSSSGYATWEEEDIETFYAAHPEGSKARLAFDLLIYTGLRRSDVVRLGRQHVRGDFIVIRQSKTGGDVQISIHPDLEQAIDKLPKENATFLTTEHGKPFTPAGFGNWLRERVKEAGLRDALSAGDRGLSAHGLRKATLRRLAEAGCSAHEIIAISGHKHIAEVMRYTQAADQKRLSQNAIAALGSRRPRTEA